MKVVGGKPFYGEAIGILKFDNKRFPVIPGSVGNSCSYDFPVRLKVIPGVEDNPFPPIRGTDGELTQEVQAIVQAVKEIEAEGVRAIALNCGFFSLIQDVVAESVEIPVRASSRDDDPLDIADAGKGQGRVCVDRFQESFVMGVLRGRWGHQGYAGRGSRPRRLRRVQRLAYGRHVTRVGCRPAARRRRDRSSGGDRW